MRRVLRQAGSVGKACARSFDEDAMTNNEADNGIERGSLTPHVQTYDRVIALLKWGTVTAVVIAALVVWLIAS